MIMKIYGISTVFQSMGQIFGCAKVNKKIACLSVLIITSENIPQLSLIWQKKVAAWQSEIISLQSLKMAEDSKLGL